ncbi:MLO-like protein 2, partial [Striga hermonthica]
MAGASGGRSLEQTPTWAVAVVCFALVAVSIVIEYIMHLIGKWLKKRHKMALYESLEKVKSVGQGPISNICISKEVAATWHPCSKRQEAKKYPGSHRRRLLAAGDDDDDAISFRRVLAGYGADKCAEKGKVAFVSSDGIHQLHIFIFVLAVFHVLYCILTMALGRAKMRSWKSWEKETRTTEYQFSNDPERFRFARETSFGRRHLNFWSKTPVLLWIVCFFRQFVRSVPRVDYLTLRHGFIMAHLAPQSQANFDFQKYINRSLEEDFKVVVGIRFVYILTSFCECNSHFLAVNNHGFL